MKSSLSPCSDNLRHKAQELQFDRIGVAKVAEMPLEVMRHYREWISNGCHGEMAYMARYEEVRQTPSMLLGNAQSAIVVVANYHTPINYDNDALQWASYALGDDYHEVMRHKLSLLASFIQQTWGGETRVCVDTAPIFERYWAQQAGVGFIGRNKMLIVPGLGSFVFIGIVLSTIEFKPDEPCMLDCMGCNACIRHCPGKALSLSGTLDARRCHSYLTIEHRGELPQSIDLGNKIYGCDVCQNVCPHNHIAPITSVIRFQPRKEILSLSHSDITAMTQEQFSRIFSNSAIKRTKLAGLLRNALQKQKTEPKTDSASLTGGV